MHYRTSIIVVRTLWKPMPGESCGTAPGALDQGGVEGKAKETNWPPPRIASFTLARPLALGRATAALQKLLFEQYVQSPPISDRFSHCLSSAGTAPARGDHRV